MADEEKLETFECPVPLVAPFGFEVTAPMVRDVWETFVVNSYENKNDLPQSGEMRVLMGILRAVNAGLEKREKTPEPFDPRMPATALRASYENYHAARARVEKLLTELSDASGHVAELAAKVVQAGGEI
jgi:hypothetical protein